MDVPGDLFISHIERWFHAYFPALADDVTLCTFQQGQDEHFLRMAGTPSTTTVVRDDEVPESLRGRGRADNGAAGNGHSGQLSWCFWALRCFLGSGVHKKHHEARINRASTMALHRQMG